MSTLKIPERLDRLPVLPFHKRLLLLCGIGWLFDSLDVGILTFVMTALKKDWSLTPSILGVIASAGFLGMFVGALVSGTLSDRYGRKKIFQVTLLIYSIGTFFNAFAWNLASLLVLRFIVGVGLGGELPVVSSLLSEFVPKAHRGKFLVILESFWAFGWIFAALIAFLVIPKLGWRIAFLFGGLPAFYVAILRRALPESPRWLQEKGRGNEAEEIISSLEAEAGGEVKAISPSEEMIEKKAPVSELFRGEYLRRTLMLWILWFTLVFGYYGIFVWLPTLLYQAGYTMVKSFGYVLLITLSQVPGYYSAAFLIDRWGRKRVLTLYLALSAVFALLYGFSHSTAQVLITGSLISFFNLGAWGAVYAYTPELYPTRLRGTGVGTASAIGRLGGILAPSVVGLLLVHIGQSGVFTLNAFILLVGALAVLILGIETKKKSLEEISR